MAKLLDIYVVEMAEGMNFEVTKNGATGFRKYIDASAYSNVTEVEPATIEYGLPNIGDQWDDNFPNCRCQRIKMNYLKDCPISNGDGTWRFKTYECYYESTLVDLQDDANFTGQSLGEIGSPPEYLIENLLVSAEIGGQFISIDISAADLAAGKGFKWLTDSADCKQAVNVATLTTNYKLAKEIVNRTEFELWSGACVGHVNSATFLGCPIGTLLYHGANLTAYISESGTRKYHAEMSFEYRSVTGMDTPTEDSGDLAQVDGWNFIIREDRATATDQWWDRPYWVDVDGTFKFLYDSADFTTVIMAGSEGPDFPLLDAVNR